MPEPVRQPETRRDTARCIRSNSSRFVVHAFREGNTRSQRVFFAQLCDNAGYRLNGIYLEANYREFNAARESAMLTARSDQFAEFLASAVRRARAPGEPQFARRADRAQHRGAQAQPRPHDALRRPNVSGRGH